MGCASSKTKSEPEPEPESEPESEPKVVRRICLKCKVLDGSGAFFTTNKFANMCNGHAYLAAECEVISSRTVHVLR